MLAELLRHLLDQRDLEVFHNDARTVGHLHDRVERGDGAGRVDQRFFAECGADCVARTDKTIRIRAQNGFNELGKQGGVRHAAIDRTVDDGFEVDILAFMIAARTEQRRMTGGSIIAAVDGGCLGGDEFELRVGDGAVFAVKIPDRILWQIKRDIEVEEADHGLRYQT